MDGVMEKTILKLQLKQKMSTIIQLGKFIIEID